MRAHQWFAGQLVERSCKTLSKTTAVDEQQRGSMSGNQLQQAWMDRRPDRGSYRSLCCGTARNFNRRRESRHVFDWHLDAKLQLFLLRRVDDGDRPKCCRLLI